MFSSYDAREASVFSTQLAHPEVFGRNVVDDVHVQRLGTHEVIVQELGQAWQS